jgi:hypothetical protein
MAMAEDVVDVAPALAPEAATAAPALVPEAVAAAPPEAPRQGLAWIADVAALLGEDPAAREAAEARLIQGGASAVTALAPALQRGDPSQHARLQRTLELIAAHAGAPDAEPAQATGVADSLLQLVENLDRASSIPELTLPDPGAGIAGLLNAAAQWSGQGEQLLASQAGAAQVQARQCALLHVAGTVAGDQHLPALEALAAQAPLAEAVCAVIGQIPGAAADAALERLITHPQPAVRRMAAACLAERGVASAIPMLRQCAVEKPGEAAALESAVASLGGAPAGLSNKLDGVDPVLLTRWITLGLRAGQALAARGDSEAAAALLERCIVNAVSWEQVRSGLLLLAGLAPVEAGRLALAYLANAEVRDTALDVLMRVPGTGIDERLAQAYKRAEPVTQAAILEILAARGAMQAPTLAAEATESDSPELRSVAAEVTGAGAAPEDLLAVAALGSAWRRPAALRAFLDQAHALAVSGAAPEAAARFRAVLESPFEAGVLGEALEGLGACGIAADLELLEGARERSDLRESAFRGLVSYWAVQEDADAARAALQTLAREAPSEDAAGHAVQAMAQLGQGIAELPAQRGWIVNWNVLGPVPWPEGASPETPLFAEGRGDAAATVEYEGALYGWDVHTAEGIPALLDLSALLAAGAQDAVLYACATLRLPQWTPANLLVSVDGQLLVWVNNELVHQSTRAQSFAAGNTEVAIRLRPGLNRIVLKLLPGTGPCRFAARLTDRRSAPIDLTGQRLPDDGLAGTGLRPPSLQGNTASELP